MSEKGAVVSIVRSVLSCTPQIQIQTYHIELSKRCYCPCLDEGAEEQRSCEHRLLGHQAALGEAGLTVPGLAQADVQLAQLAEHAQRSTQRIAQRSSLRGLRS